MLSPDRDHALAVQPKKSVEVFPVPTQVRRDHLLERAIVNGVRSIPGMGPILAAVVVYERRAGRRLNSEILVADAHHTTSDLATSLTVIAALIGVRFGYTWLDPAAALIVAGWCRNFDLKVIDGIIHGVARWGVRTAKGSGRFDLGIVDGLANLVANVSWRTGAWLRNIQTGYLRSYILFLALAAVGIWIVLAALLGAASGAGR